MKTKNYAVIFYQLMPALRLFWKTKAGTNVNSGPFWKAKMFEDQEAAQAYIDKHLSKNWAAVSVIDGMPDLDKWKDA